MARKSNAGRPTVMTNEVIRKLEEAFEMGCTDIEACLHAGISKSSLYDYQVQYPEFTDRKEALKENPALKARITLYRGLDKDENAKWYLERKKSDEFGTKQHVDLTSKGEQLKTIGVDYIKAEQ